MLFKLDDVEQLTRNDIRKMYSDYVNPACFDDGSFRF